MLFNLEDIIANFSNNQLTQPLLQICEISRDVVNGQPPLINPQDILLYKKMMIHYLLTHPLIEMPQIFSSDMVIVDAFRTIETYFNSTLLVPWLSQMIAVAKDISMERRAITEQDFRVFEYLYDYYSDLKSRHNIRGLPKHEDIKTAFDIIFDKYAVTVNKSQL